MKKYFKFLVLIIFFFFFFQLNVFASTNINLNSRFNVIYEEVDYSSIQIDSQGHSVKDFFDNVITLARSSEYYDTIIFANTFNPLTEAYSVKYQIFLIEKDTIDSSNYSTFFGRKSSLYVGRSRFQGIASNIQAYSFIYSTFIIDSNSYEYNDYHDIPTFDSLSSCLLQNTGCSNLSLTTLSSGSDFMLSSDISFNNFTSFTFDLFDRNYLSTTQSGSRYAFSGSPTPYFSTFPLILSNSYIPTTTEDLYFKTISINDVIYTIGDVIPTYCEIYNICSSQSSSSFVDYKPYLSTIYTNFVPNDVSNFKLDIEFNTDNITGLDYYNNLGFDWSCYGRVNNNNEYYSYEKFPYCDFESNSSSSDNNVKFSLENFAIYDSTDNVINDFSRYDKLFFYIHFLYKDDNKSKIVNDLKFNFTGNVFYEDRFFAPIYDTFRNLPLNFKMFLSTSKKDYSYFYAKYVSSHNDSLFSIRRQSYDINNLLLDINPGYITKDFSPYSAFYTNNSSNTGFMIFQNPSTLDDDNFVGLDLVLNPDIIISLRDSSNNNFNYYDSSGSITSSIITIDFSNQPNNSYDLSYYLKQVDNFVNELSDSAIIFSNYMQEFYDNLPFVFQSFIFIIFILFCVYFTFLLIKRK